MQIEKEKGGVEVLPMSIYSSFFPTSPPPHKTGYSILLKHEHICKKNNNKVL